MYGKGISKSGDLIDLAINEGVVKKSGAWFYYGENNEMRLGQGRENAKKYFEDHPVLMAQVENTIREKHGLAAEPVPEDDDDDDLLGQLEMEE